MAVVWKKFGSEWRGFVFFVVLHRNLKILQALGATEFDFAAEFDFEN
jgi:hypothetical protein